MWAQSYVTKQFLLHYINYKFWWTVISILITKLNEWTYEAGPSLKTDTPQLV